MRTPAQTVDETPPAASADKAAAIAESITPEEQTWLERFARALTKLPPGRERDLWRESLRRNTELIEAFAERMIDPKALCGE